MSAWLDTVKKQHEEGKKTNPDYTYKQAMIDASAKKNGNKAPKGKKSSKGSKKSKKCCPCPQKGGTDADTKTDPVNEAIDEDVTVTSQAGGKRRRRKSSRRKSSRHDSSHGSLYHHVTKRGGKSRRRKGGKKTRRGGRKHKK